MVEDRNKSIDNLKENAESRPKEITVWKAENI